jgi:choline-sulfatase
MVMLFDQSLISEYLIDLVKDEQANVFLYDKMDHLVYSDVPEQTEAPAPGDIISGNVGKVSGKPYLYAKSRSGQIQPLLLKVSVLQPHYPYLTSEDKFTYYLNRVAPYLNEQAFDHPFLSKFRIQTDVHASEREIRRAAAAYYGMIETIDEYFGKVMEALEHVGQNLDDWIVIYTTDHGEMLGQHGVWEKQKFYEASAKVPLVIRYPKCFEGGGIVEENVNLCDLFATICELCDVPAPTGLDSRSMVPLMSDHASGWDNETVSQFGGTNLMIKRDHLKYQYYGPDSPEVLFDLQRNPEETVNFISNPDYAELVEHFRERARNL